MYNVLAVFIWAETTITDTSKKQQLAPKKKRKKKRKQKDVSYNQIFKSSVLIVQPFHDFSHQLQRLCLTQQLPANFQVANWKVINQWNWLTAARDIKRAFDQAWLSSSLWGCSFALQLPKRIEDYSSNDAVVAAFKLSFKMLNTFSTHNMSIQQKREVFSLWKRKYFSPDFSLLNYKSELLNHQRVSLALQNVAPHPQKGQNIPRSRHEFPSINWHGKWPVNTISRAPSPTSLKPLYSPLEVMV